MPRTPMKRFETTISVPGSPDLVVSTTQESGQTEAFAAAYHAAQVALFLASEQPNSIGSWTVVVS